MDNMLSFFIGLILLVTPAMAAERHEGWVLFKAPHDSGCTRKAPDYGTQITGDFDGNGKNDSAKLEVHMKQKKSRLAVWMNGSLQPSIVRSWNELPDDDYLELVESAEMETWCGKTKECAKDKPRKIRLKKQSIGYGTCESSMAVLAWDPKSQGFKEYWISD